MNDLLLAFIVFSAAWLGASSLVALVLCRRWKRQDRRIRTACAFDPIATHGIERGDLRGLKIGGRR